MTRLAIFDFDGTLTDSTAWFYDVVNEAARKHRFREVREDEREMLRASSSTAILRHVGVPRWKLPAITRTMQAAMRRDIDQFEPFDFVPDVFDRLIAEDIRIAVVSSNTEANIRHILGPEITARVDTFETGAGLFSKAKHFRAAMRKTGATRVVTIGDEERDILAARKLGIPALSVTWGFAARDLLTRVNPGRVIDDPEALIAAIRTGTST